MRSANTSASDALARRSPGVMRGSDAASGAVVAAVDMWTEGNQIGASTPAASRASTPAPRANRYSTKGI